MIKNYDMKLLQPSMMCCFFTLMVKHYTGHRVIYMIQFDITNNINNRLLKGGTYRTIIFLITNISVFWSEYF